MTDEIDQQYQMYNNCVNEENIELSKFYKNENEVELNQANSTEVNTQKEEKKEKGEKIICNLNEDSKQKKEENNFSSKASKMENKWILKEEKKVFLSLDSINDSKNEMNSDSSKSSEKIFVFQDGIPKIPIPENKTKFLGNKRNKKFEPLDEMEKEFKRKKINNSVYNAINNKENDDYNFPYSEEDLLGELKFQNFFGEEDDDEKLNNENTKVSEVCSNKAIYNKTDNIFLDSMTDHYHAVNFNHFTESPSTFEVTNS